ncbi:MAG TPA: DUF6152 family protein [Terriglobia bacterium]|nr:DUF6152 family protein [Terriglobia bacterium]
MRNNFITVVAIFALTMAVTLPLAAHHSFSAEFDGSKSVTLEGKVVKMEWVNPHSWLYLDVPTADGKIEQWKVEGGSPNVLLRLGWTRDSLPAGTKIKVVGSPAKDGAKRLNSRNIEFPDGRKLSLGSSNPDDDKPKADKPK